MNFSEYQLAALRTRQIPIDPGAGDIVPLLGLSGEVGELLNAYKKRLRDGEAHQHFEEQIAEELGDILWYLADVASNFGLNLDDIAERNLEKVIARWGPKGNLRSLVALGPRNFDAAFPEHERFPRKFSARFEQQVRGDAYCVRVFVEGRQMGQTLTDNSHDLDGYRFHDVFHLACTAILGWSPVTRRNLQSETGNYKRRSNLKVDEIEDGGRAIVTEEGISALVFAYARDHDGLLGISSVDYSLLKVIKILVRPFEVSICTTGEWEYTILEAYRVWKHVEENAGGTLDLDLDARTIEYSK